METYRNVKITGKTARGRDTVLEIDGQDVSAACHRVIYDATANDVVRVTVSLFSKSALVEGRALVRICPESAALLQQLGWTPPEPVAEPADRPWWKRLLGISADAGTTPAVA